jgi:hypothetical protein
MKITASMDLANPANPPVYLIIGETPKERFLVQRTINHLKEASAKPLTDSEKCEYSKIYTSKEEAQEVELAAKRLTKVLETPEKKILFNVAIPASTSNETYTVTPEEAFQIRRASDKVAELLSQIPEYFNLSIELKQCVLGQKPYRLKDHKMIYFRGF